MAEPLRLIVWPGMPDAGGLEEAGRRLGRELDVTVISTNEDLEELIDSEAPYDLICPSDYLVEKLASEGRLADLDDDLAARRDGLEDWSRVPSWDREEQYSMPLAFGTTGLLHSTSRAPGLDSWAEFFDPGPGVHVGLLGEVRETIGAALIASGHSPNEAEPGPLEDAAALLERQHPAVRSVSSDDFTGPVERGEVAIHHAWSGPAAMAMRRVAGLRYCVPREGALLWVTTAAIPTDAPDPDAARRLLLELTDPEVAALAVTNGGYSSPSRLVRESLPVSLREDETLFPDEDTIRRCSTVLSLTPERTRLMDRLWTRFDVPQEPVRAVDSRA